MYLPSEIARLVLSYLLDQSPPLKTTVASFLEESPHLVELVTVTKKDGGLIQLSKYCRVGGNSLDEVLSKHTSKFLPSETARLVLSYLLDQTPPLQTTVASFLADSPQLAELFAVTNSNKVEDYSQLSPYCRVGGKCLDEVISESESSVPATKNTAMDTALKIEPEVKPSNFQFNLNPFYNPVENIQSSPMPSDQAQYNPLKNNDQVQSSLAQNNDEATIELCINNPHSLMGEQANQHQLSRSGSFLSERKRGRGRPRKIAAAPQPTTTTPRCGGRFRREMTAPQKQKLRSFQSTSNPSPCLLSAAPSQSSVLKQTCPYCSKQFTKLNIHIALKHPEKLPTQIPSYKCPLCKSVMKQENQGRHMEKVHKKRNDVDEYIVEQVISARKERGKMMYQVRWVLGDTTWEPETNLTKCKVKISDYWKQQKAGHSNPPSKKGGRKIELCVKCIEKDTSGKSMKDVKMLFSETSSVRKVKMKYCRVLGVNMGQLQLFEKGNLLEDDKMVMGLEGEVLTAEGLVWG